MSVTVTIPAACVAGKRWPGMFGDLTPAVPRFQYGHGGDLYQDGMKAYAREES